MGAQIALRPGQRSPGARRPSRGPEGVRKSTYAGTSQWGPIQGGRDRSGPRAATRDEGDLPAAREQIHLALEIVESIRTRVLDPGLRTSFLATKQDFYAAYIDSLMPARGAPPDPARILEALQVSERARARSLLDVLSESGADIRKGADPALVAQERRLRDAINTLEGQRFNLLAGEKADRRKLDQIERKLKETSPSTTGSRQGSARVARSTPR